MIAPQNGVYSGAVAQPTWCMLIARQGDNFFGIRNGRAFETSSTPAANGQPSTFHPLNPLAMIIRLTYNNNTYTAVARFNPRRKTINSSATKNGVGDITITHNLGAAVANVSYMCQHYSTANFRTVRVASYTTMAVTIYTGLTNTKTDLTAGDYVDIFIYDYTPL